MFCCFGSGLKAYIACALRAGELQDVANGVDKLRNVSFSRVSERPLSILGGSFCFVFGHNGAYASWFRPEREGLLPISGHLNPEVTFQNIGKRANT